MATMTLVEKHDFLKGSAEYKELDKLCFLSKNLYNARLYTVRQHFFATKKFLVYSKLTSQFTETNQADYRAFPAKVAQQTLRLINQNFSSFFCTAETESRRRISRQNTNPEIFTQTERAASVTLHRPSCIGKIPKRLFTSFSNQYFHKKQSRKSTIRESSTAKT